MILSIGPDAYLNIGWLIEICVRRIPVQYLLTIGPDQADSY
jgi:hypothetical protein